MKDEAQSALRDLVIALERMDSDDLDQFRQEPGVKLLLEWVGHQRPSQTPSPDVMEVWRDAVYAYGGQSIEGGESEDYAARVIAEAKARWEAEAFEKAAQVAEVDADHSDALFTAAAGDDEGKDRNAARYRTALRIAREIRALKEPRS